MGFFNYSRHVALYYQCANPTIIVRQHDQGASIKIGVPDRLNERANHNFSKVCCGNLNVLHTLPSTCNIVLNKKSVIHNFIRTSWPCLPLALRFTTNFVRQILFGAVWKALQGSQQFPKIEFHDFPWSFHVFSMINATQKWWLLVYHFTFLTVASTSPLLVTPSPQNMKQTTPISWSSWEYARAAQIFFG